VITGLKLEPGQVVAAGQAVITLAHTAETEIVLDVPENRLPAIRTADTIEVITHVQTALYRNENDGKHHRAPSVRLEAGWPCGQACVRGD